MRRLTGAQVRQLRDAILLAFGPSDLEQLVRFVFDEPLANIAPHDKHEVVVFKLIEWAGQRGGTTKLIRAVQQDRPDHQELQSVARELLSALIEPPKGEAPPPVTPPGPTDQDKQPTDQDKRRWEMYRIGVRQRLEELLEELGREVQGLQILVQVADALQLEIAPQDGDILRERIAAHLCESKAEHSIGRLMGLHDKLYEKGWARQAKVIWRCAGQVFPLCIPLEVFIEIWGQCDGPKLVLIRGTVATEVGAEVVVAVADGKGPSIVTHELGPRGKYWIEFQWPAPDDPSFDKVVLAVLEHLVKQSEVELNEGMRRHQQDDVVARTGLLSKVLRGWLGSRRIRTGRTPYCTLVMMGKSTESERRMTEWRMRVLERVRELVPYLWFIELNPESKMLESEFVIMDVVTAQLKMEDKRNSG
jgi:hypothetical protein